MATTMLNDKFVVIHTKENRLEHFEKGVSGPEVILGEQVSHAFLEHFRRDPEKALEPVEPPPPRDWEKAYHELERLANGHERMLIHMLEQAMGSGETGLDSIQLANEVATRLNEGVSA